MGKNAELDKGIEVFLDQQIQRPFFRTLLAHHASLAEVSWHFYRLAQKRLPAGI